MSTEFWIQASSPRSHRSVDAEASTLDEAIEGVFPLEAEAAYVVWQQVHIPLSYKYDVSVIVADVLQMLDILMSGENGEWQVAWPSNTFGADWRFEWKGERLKITATEWRSVVGDTEDLLRARPVVEMPKGEFISEWKPLLQKVHGALVDAGCTPESFPELGRLGAAIKRIEMPGRLYR